MKKALLSRMRVLFILGHYLIAMKMKLSEAYLQCQDKSGRLGGMAGSVVLYVMFQKKKKEHAHALSQERTYRT
jgi:hypothetical protein